MQSTTQRITEQYPPLRRLNEADTLSAYAKDAMMWTLNKTVFPQSQNFISLIGTETAKLYGSSVATQLQNQLHQRTYLAETGPHLHLPRDFDKTSVPSQAYANINTLVVQSALTTTALHAEHDLPLKLSLYTGIIPSTNTNSANYLQISSDSHALTRLVPDKMKQYVGAYLPAMNDRRLDDLHHNTKTHHDRDQTRKDDVFNIFRTVGKSFSDQISSASSYLYNEVQAASGVQQVTLDYHKVATQYMISLLEDENSVVSKIFANDETARKFSKDFANIGTGWSWNDEKQETPFYNLQSKVDPDSQQLAYKTAGSYAGPCDRETVLEGLKNNTLTPTGVMCHFATMIEGGILSLGGMFQATYCTDIRDRSVKLLRKMGYTERAESLAAMPTEIALVSPAWGVEDTAAPDLVNYGRILTRPALSADVFASIPQVTGQASLYAALPCLTYLSGETMDTQEWQKGLSRHNIIRL